MPGGANTAACGPTSAGDAVSDVEHQIGMLAEAVVNEGMD